jgi:hypothetical protein
MAGPYTSSTQLVARLRSERVAVQFLGKPERDRTEDHQGSDFHLNLPRTTALGTGGSMGAFVLKKRDESTFSTEYFPK